MINFALINRSSIEVYKLWVAGNIKQFPNGYWDKEDSKEQARRLFKWFLEERLCWSDEKIRKDMRIKLFNKYKLIGVLNKVYDGSYYRMLEDIYPDRFSRKEFSRECRAV